MGYRQNAQISIIIKVVEEKSNNRFDFQLLTQAGLTISEDAFNLMKNNLLAGVEEAKLYLNAVEDEWPKFNFSNDAGALGYSGKDDAICISINHLNQAASRNTSLEYKDQLLLFVPDVFYLIVKYLHWLKLLGRESTIHRYQKHGNTKLNAKYPEALPGYLSNKLLLFSDFEVEARGAVDAIAEQSGEGPIWKNVDEYLEKTFAQYYRKNIDDLLKFPKPEFHMSFEMEFNGYGN